MFSNIENVNILTSVLESHGCRRVVVCPGSRNAPIVHNFNEIAGITCYPVTDERSAGFYAIGLALGDISSSHVSPIAVCVTSGSALLNLHPAVAEAYYQKLPIIFISADRPAEWIGQQDGQTLPQANVFGSLVNRSVNLPVINSDDQRWFCEREVNEAVIDCVHRKIGPVHINIQIQEPLYEFTQENLPKARLIEYARPTDRFSGIESYDVRDFLEAKRPMIVIGQDYPDSQLYGIKDLANWAVTLCEPTGLALYSEPASRKFSDKLLMTNFEEVLVVLEREEAKAALGQEPAWNVNAFKPDFILYVGGCIVSKRLKKFLRSCKEAKVWRVSRDGDAVDTFMHLNRIFEMEPNALAFRLMDFHQEHEEDVRQYRELWEKALLQAKRHAFRYEPPFSSMAAVKYLQQEFLASSLDDNRDSRLFYGNSMAIRLACIYARQYVHCLRGVNGIEGTLSAAAGLSRFLSEQNRVGKNEVKVFCVLGDLSFFYDQNALWNQNLNGSLRIIVLNNSGGAIFGKFQGLKESSARERLVMAEHHTSAFHACQANKVIYLSANNMKTLKAGIDQLLHQESERPMLLEVFTDIDTDNQALKAYHNFQISIFNFQII